MKPFLILSAVTAFAIAGMAGAASAQMFGPGNGLVNDAARALDSKQWDKGVAIIQQAFRSGDLTPSNMPAAYNNLCIGLTGQRKFDDAIVACNKAVEMQPREWKFYNNRANIYFYLGQFDKALAEYYKAMTFSPGDSVLMTNIGISLNQRRVLGSRDRQKTS